MKSKNGAVRMFLGYVCGAARRAGLAAAYMFTRLCAVRRAIRDRVVAAPVSKRSLRFRLSVFFSLLLVVAWLAAAFFAWKECREHINEFFDSQQVLFAKTLAVADLPGAGTRLPQAGRMLPGADKKIFGDLEDDAIGFAVFTTTGQRVFSDGGKGRYFPFAAGGRGFSEVRLVGDDDVWRIVWMPALDGRHVIAVGQELEYRRDMVLDMLGEQLAPWLLLLPVLLGGLYLLLSRELAPLRAIAANLRSREPENTAPLDLRAIPSEVAPMAEALNGFFARTGAMVARERSFISDAAHELRTPLAGLRVQAQVAARHDIAPGAREEALDLLTTGADRCARLVDQLLALSRLEAAYAAGPGPGGRFAELSFGFVAWASLLEECAGEYRARAAARGIHLDSHIVSLHSGVQGSPALLSMLLRNLFENAVRYTPDAGRIVVTLESGRLGMQNDCVPLPEAHAARLGERFFRPPGQEGAGSGLGLSIVGRIAELHGFALDIRPVTEASAPAGMFTVTLAW